MQKWRGSAGNVRDKSGATALSAHAVRAEVRLINSNRALIEGRLVLAFFGNAYSDFCQKS
jgi:hypothetical protein